MTAAIFLMGMFIYSKIQQAESAASVDIARYMQLQPVTGIRKHKMNGHHMQVLESGGAF